MMKLTSGTALRTLNQCEQSFEICESQMIVCHLCRLEAPFQSSTLLGMNI